MPFVFEGVSGSLLLTALPNTPNGEVPEATHGARLRALERHCVSLKSPSRVQDRVEEVAGRNRGE